MYVLYLLYYLFQVSDTIVSIVRGNKHAEIIEYIELRTMLVH
jgi:hypothetical protein